MAEDTVSVSPPYSTYKQFLNVISSLKDTKVPSRIDRSLFGNMSGGTAYSLLSTLKFLKLTDNDGIPQPLLRQLVVCGDEDERKGLINQMLRGAYPTLMDGPLNLAEASGGQFDEHLRQEFNVKGSTVDKVAAFFLAAADDAGMSLSPHLKKRKPSSASAPRRRTVKRQDNGSETPTVNPPAQHRQQRSLSHVLTDLLDVTDMNDAEMEAVWVLLRYQKRKEAAAAAQATNKE